MTPELRFRRMFNPVRNALPIVVLVLLHAGTASAAWQQDGILVSPMGLVNIHGLVVSGMIPDASQGAYVAWFDLTSFSLNVTRLDGAGNILWNQFIASSDGMLGDNVVVTSDGAAGIQIIYRRGYPDVYVQRVNSNGVKAFPDPGNIACQTPFVVNSLTALLLVSGETQVAWEDERSRQFGPGQSEIYGQRLDAQAAPLWEAGGRKLVNGDGNTYDLVTLHPNPLPNTTGAFFMRWRRMSVPFGTPLNCYIRRFEANGAAGPLPWSTGYSSFVAPDGDGGVFATWPASDDILARHIDHDGMSTAQLTICNAAGVQDSPIAVADGVGGAILTWNDARSGTPGVYAQRVDASGTMLWSNNGIPAVAATQLTGALSDGSGGALISVGSNGNSYAQRLGPAGQLLWGTPSMPLCLAGGGQSSITGVLDGGAGVLFAWDDYRFNASKPAIYAQRLSLATGQWGSAPVAVAISSFRAILRDGVVILSASLQSELGVESVKIYRASGDGPLALLDTRGSQGTQRFQYTDVSVRQGATYRYQLAVSDGDGEIVSPVAAISIPAIASRLEQNHPNPFNPETAISFTLEKTTRASVQIYSADGARVRTLLDEQRGAGSHRVTWNGRDDNGQPVSSGIYFYRLTADKFSATRKMVLLK